MAKKEKEITKISDLVPDANNYNKGTEFGQGLIEKSIRKNGLGRSLLIDRNGKVIAGNKTLEATVASGFDEDKIRVIKTDGTELIVVQRTDLDLDTRKGKEMALADNATSKANIQRKSNSVLVVSLSYNTGLIWSSCLSESTSPSVWPEKNMVPPDSLEIEDNSL